MYEPGPASPFDLNAVSLTLEAPLEPADFDIQVAGLDDVGAALDTHAATISTAVNDLTTKTFDLHNDLNIVEAEILAESNEPVSPTVQAIVEGQGEAEAAIDDAAAAVPQIASAPTSSPEATANGTNAGTIGARTSGNLAD